MIDPKLNELPVEGSQTLNAADEALLSKEERAEVARRRRAGLSVNDTIARDANLSVGSRGVDVSGVRSGAGAGAGMSNVTPGSAGESPAPNVVPGERGSGTTVLGVSGREGTPQVRFDSDEPAIEEVEARAYACWRERGNPLGSPEVDWHRAVEELRAERRRARRATASA